jgi:hypothetical protein
VLVFNVCAHWEGIKYICSALQGVGRPRSPPGKKDIGLYGAQIPLQLRAFLTYSRTPLIRINWDGEPFGYAEIPDNWSFL